MASVAERLSADAYLERDDDRRTELVDGLVVVNEPTLLHQHACGLIYAALLAWTRAAPGRGMVTLPLDVRLDERNVLAPDVLWFAEPLPMDAVRAPRVPDLAVEVRSPSTWALDVTEKRALYERHGLQELWLADTASRSVLTFRRSRAGAGFDLTAEVPAAQPLRSPLLEGFAVAVGEVLPPPPR